MSNLKKLNLNLSSRSQSFLNNLKNLTISAIKLNLNYFNNLKFNDINENITAIEQNLIKVEDLNMQLIKLKNKNKILLLQQCENIYLSLLKNNKDKTFAAQSSKKYIIKNIKDVLTEKIIIN